MGRLDVAIAEINRAIDAGYRTFLSYGYLAGAEAAKGDDAAAKLALAEARRLNPKLTTRWFAEHLIQCYSACNFDPLNWGIGVQF